MKKSFLALPLLLCGFMAFAQDKVVYDANAEIRNVSSFHAVEVSNGINLILKQGNTDAVAVSASSTDVIKRIKTEVVNGKLKIYFDHQGWHDWSSHKNMKAYVTIRNIDELEANSGADATTDGNINADNLKISLSSGADFDGSVTATKLRVDQSSGSDMEIKGKVQDIDIETSSGSDFNGYNLVSEKCSAHASSGSDIEITVNKELQAEASSGGDISYKGNASITNVSNSSGGKIKKQS